MTASLKQKTNYQILWPRAVMFFAYTLLARLFPYLLPLLGMKLDPSLGYYPWNFTPIFAVCLFTGTFCKDRRVSLLLPMATFFLGDLGIWFLTGRLDWAFYAWQPAVYLSLLGCTVIGFLLHGQHTVLKTTGAGFAGCTLFFVVTNFAMWALSNTYPHTLEGLVTCYIAAIPYYRNTLLGTAFFGAILFSPVCLREESINKTNSFAMTQAGV